MTIEEAIFVLEDGGWWDCLNLPCDDLWHKKFHDSLDMAISALRAQREAEKNEPLTRDKLLEMDGDPVWVVFTPDPDGESLAVWALVSADKDNDEIYLLNSLGGSSSYEEVWADIRAIYRRPPNGRTGEPT